jgi:hypothetical protein
MSALLSPELVTRTDFLCRIEPQLNVHGDVAARWSGSAREVRFGGGLTARLVRDSAFQASIASAVNHTVRLPQARRLASYVAQLVTRIAASECDAGGPDWL